VRDSALVELLDPALLHEQRRIARVVGHHDYVPARRLAAGEVGLDLGEERRVVVDVLAIVDMNAVLLLELVERRMLAARLVVDVERPVREVQSLGELGRDGCAAGGPWAAAAAATGREEPGNGEDRAARRCAAEKDLASDA